MTLKRTFFMDDTRPVEDRVNHLIENMTLEEKMAQIVGVWVTELIDDQRQFDEAKAQAQLTNGTGHITRVAAASFLKPADSARLTNQIQKFLIENTRLGIPAIIHEESCAGYMARDATSFPQSIGLAATFEPELVEQMAEIIRLQMRAVGAHHALAPVLDVVRDARWGRVEETYGEDPFLITRMGIAYIRGIQTDNLRDGVVATGKHFVAHGLPEGGMNWAPVHVGERELREVFLTPFKAAIQHGELASIMNAYHELDGIPCGSSREIMVDLLRDELGFDGVVVSDYYTLKTLVDYHQVAHDKSEAAKMGLEAGIDVELPFADCYGEPLKKALENGNIPVELVEVSVRRILKMKFDLGLFEQPYVDEGSVLEVYNTPEQLNLARELAQKSIVLLKNDGLLPLSKSLKSLAVIGPHADSMRLLQGDYHYPAHFDHIFAQQTADNAPNPQEKARAFDWDEHLPAGKTVLEALQAAVSDGTELRYAQGCEVSGEDQSGFAEAVAAAQAADVALLVLGDKSGLGDSATVGESVDSAELRLPGVQQELIEAVQASGTPIVLVLITGRPYTFGQVIDDIAAVVEAWLPSQAGGLAIADVLFGDVNPGGKLPISFPRSAGQVPVYYNHKPSGGRSNWKGGYRDMSAKPLFAFGHGLSYTEFTYSDLTLSETRVAPDGSVTISVTVKNTGAAAGDEVVQLYLEDPVATVTQPVKMLKGFKRINLQPDEQKTVEFQLDVRHLAFYDRQMQYVVEPGVIKVMVGSASDDIRLSSSFEITGTTTEVEQVFFTPAAVK